MAQLSRPFQIGLAAVVVLAGAWLLLLHGHNSPNEPASAPSASQVASTPAKPAAPVKKAEGSAGSATGHGSASSLGSLGHAVEKARGAVGTSQQNERQLKERSRQASSETTSSSAAAPATKAPAPSATKSSATTTSTPAPAASAPAKSKPATPGAASRGSTARQRTVEAQLHQGKVAVILFWDPQGSDDRLVHKALRSLRGDSSLKIAIDEALPSQVASFGTVTRGVQVFGTPTLLFVNGKDQALVRSGFQDAYTIAQAVREARHAAKA